MGPGSLSETITERAERLIFQYHFLDSPYVEGFYSYPRRDIDAIFRESLVLQMSCIHPRSSLK